MRSTRQQARLAGWVYLLMLLVGTPGLLLVPGKFVVHGDAAATADHIRAAESFFRAGVVSQLAGQVAFLFVGLCLYRLLSPVSRTLANQMLGLVVLSIPVAFANAVNELAALAVVNAPPYLAGFTKLQRDSLAYLFLHVYGEGIGVLWVLWGLWLVPFGLLVIRSRFLPRTLGFLLLAAAAGDLLTATTSLAPTRLDALFDAVAKILALGELPIAFWLLLWGAKESAAPKPVAIA